MMVRILRLICEEILLTLREGRKSSLIRMGIEVMGIPVCLAWIVFLRIGIVVVHHKPRSRSTDHGPPLTQSIKYVCITGNTYNKTAKSTSLQMKNAQSSRRGALQQQFQPFPQE